MIDPDDLVETIYTILMKWTEDVSLLMMNELIEWLQEDSNDIA